MRRQLSSVWRPGQKLLAALHFLEWLDAQSSEGMPQMREKQIDYVGVESWRFLLLPNDKRHLDFSQASLRAKNSEVQSD